MIIDLNDIQGLQEYSMTTIMRETPLGLMQCAVCCVKYDGLQWVQIEPSSPFFIESESGDIARLVFGPISKD